MFFSHVVLDFFHFVLTEAFVDMTSDAVDRVLVDQIFSFDLTQDDVAVWQTARI